MTTATIAKLVLPTKKSEVDNRWIAQKFGVIGPPGIGKSEFLSHGEKTLYLQTEAGLNHLSVFKVAIRSWDELGQIYGLLMQAKQDGKLEYDTIVIDTIDKLVDLANQEAIERGRNKFKAMEINTIGDIPNGAGWSWSTELIENALAKLEALEVCVWYVGHLENREVKMPTTSIHKQTISIGGKTGGLLLAWPDHFLNIQANMIGTDLKRVVRTIPTQTIDAKSRGGMVLDGWVWGKDSKENYARLRQAFK